MPPLSGQAEVLQALGRRSFTALAVHEIAEYRRARDMGDQECGWQRGLPELTDPVSSAVQTTVRTVRGTMWPRSSSAAE